ncbi:MAG: serine protease [bacterium]|nr:serine protease [bacterium]
MNKKCILILLFIMLTASQVSGEVNLSKLVEKTQPAVVTIITYDKKKNVTGMGTGFFIDKKGHLITNFHVLEGAYSAKVKAHNSTTYPVWSVIAEDEKMDIVKVLAGIPETSYDSVKVNDKLPTVAERLVVIGSPMGLELTVSEGIVSAVRSIEEIGNFFQMSAPISKGSSGSPVINMKGEVIGVATFQFVEGQNLNFAVPGQYISGLKNMKNPESVSAWNHRIRKELEKKQIEEYDDDDLFDYTESEKTIYIIHLKNGKIIKTDKMWEESEMIKVNRYGSVVGYAKDSIKRVEETIINKTDENHIAAYYKPEASVRNVKSSSRLYGIWYDYKNWRRHYPGKKGVAEFHFKHKYDGAYAVAILESEMIPMPTFIRKVITSAIESGPDAKIVYKDKRIIQ